MRVLVTGASGFLGSHVARRLASLGHRVVATGREASRLEGLADTTCTRAIANLATDDLGDLVRGCEAIVHCAARASAWGNRMVFREDNVLATERLVCAAAQAGTSRRFVFISTPSIYFQPRDQLLLTEEFSPPARWSTAYAESKWQGERCVLGAPDLGPVILRPRAIFGPGDNAIVPRLIAVAKSGVFPLPGAGNAWTDVTYVDNVVDAVGLALTGGRDIEGRAFNVTNGEPLRVHDLLTRLFKALQIRTRLLPLPRRAAFVLAQFSERLTSLRANQTEPRLTCYGMGLLAYSQTLCIQAARQDLRYAPRVSVDEGLERYATWQCSR